MTRSTRSPGERAARDPERLDHAGEVRVVEPAHDVRDPNRVPGGPQISCDENEERLASRHGLELALEALEVEVVLADVRRRPRRDQRCAEHVPDGGVFGNDRSLHGDAPFQSFDTEGVVATGLADDSVQRSRLRG